MGTWLYYIRIINPFLQQLPFCKQGINNIHLENILMLHNLLVMTASTIKAHNTELQMVKVHINNTKHITIANIYIPSRDTTSTHYKTADTDIQHCIQYLTNILLSPHRRCGRTLHSLALVH